MLFSKLFNFLKIVNYYLIFNLIIKEINSMNVMQNTMQNPANIQLLGNKKIYSAKFCSFKHWKFKILQQNFNKN
uniref:Uncharacterized protein n=1 Tax=Meloidogyne enterolobii TaxID=390850 RepID=A0A6V7WAL7_MELEN|nr:unnamed protein product [Meloidogyne enterolobii]